MTLSLSPIPSMISVGPHRVTHGSITDQALDAMLSLDTQPIRVCYTDPPWGDGHMKYFATLNQKQTGTVSPPLSFDGMLRRIYGLIRTYVRGWIFIEIGLRWEQQVLAAVPLHGTRTIRTWYKSGGKTNENVLICGTTGPEFAPYTDTPAELGSVGLPRSVVGAVTRPGDLVFDPCCGHGYTARAALAAHAVFRGNELNRARLDRCLDVLRGGKR